MLITEYMAGGNLQQHLARRRAEGNDVSPGRQLLWLQHLAHAMTYLHEHKPRYGPSPSGSGGAACGA